MTTRTRTIVSVLAAVGCALVLTGFARSGNSGAATEAGAESSRRVESLTTPKAVVLGVVEGATEYLPVSSTGHLLITERILDVGQHGNDKDATDTYTVVIQIGAILAVLGIFRNRFTLMLAGVTGRSAEGRNLVMSLLLAFVPSVVIALAFQDPIKERLLKPWPVVAAWAIGGIAILVFGRFRERTVERITTLAAITPKVALGIGFAQALALWPGTSRSLVTILAALLLGCSLVTAVEFSFLLGFLTLSAATGYELLKNGSTLIDTFGVINPIIGIVVAGIAAFASVKWMISYLEHRSLDLFGWYRIGIAALTAILLVGKVI